MTAYVDCKECGTPVPWYYAFNFRGLPHNDAMHPMCAMERIGEEGCGATIVALIIAYELFLWDRAMAISGKRVGS